MPLRRAAATAVLALLLASPAGALAQAQPPNGVPSLQGAPPPGASGSQSPAAGAGSGTPQSQSPPDQAQSQPSGDARLPATGSRPGLVALAGLGLLMAGFGLRLRVSGA